MNFLAFLLGCSFDIPTGIFRGIALCISKIPAEILLKILTGNFSVIDARIYKAVSTAPDILLELFSGIPSWISQRISAGILAWISSEISIEIFSITPLGTTPGMYSGILLGMLFKDCTRDFFRNHPRDLFKNFHRGFYRHYFRDSFKNSNRVSSCNSSGNLSGIDSTGYWIWDFTFRDFSENTLRIVVTQATHML